MFRIRRFVRGDEEAYIRAYNDGYRREDWWRALDKPIAMEDALKLDYDATFFAEVEAQTVGLVDVRTYGDEAHIENIVVTREHRRKGIGTALLEKAIEFSKARSVEKIRAETPIQNGSKFFEKNGFRFSRHAFLIHVKDKTKMEPSPNLSFEGDNRYWVDDDQQMGLIIGKMDFEIIAEYRVLIKNM